MGRYVTTVGSSTVVLIEDTPDVIRQSVQGSILQNTNIATDLLNTVSNTYAHKVRAAHRYAKDKYYLGLPEGTFGRLAVNLTKLRTVLDTIVVLEEGQTYEILNAQLDTVKPIIFGNESFRAIDRYDYKRDVVLDVILYKKGGSSSSKVRDIGITSAQLISPTKVSCYFEYVERNSEGNIIGIWANTYVQDIVNQDYNKMIDDPLQFYYYTVYQIKDKDGKDVGLPYLWNYWENSGKFPILDRDDSDLAVNQYMPVIPFRVNNRSLFTWEGAKESTEYKSSKPLLNLLGLDIDDLAKGIDENPDINSVDHAYVILGVNVFSKKPEADKYLFEYLKHLHFNSNNNANYIGIKDITYNVSLRWDKTQFRQYVGVIGKVGSVQKKITLGSYDRLIVSKQVNPTTVQEYSIFDLVLVNHIYGSGLSVRTALDASGIDQEALCIPLNISIMEKALTPIEANTVYYDSLRIVFNAFERKKLKWYQTGIFKFVFAVVAVAISIVTVGAGAALVGLVVGVGINMALELLTKLTTAIFGEEVGAIVATIAAVTAVVIAFATGVIPDVTSLLALGVSVTTGIAGIYVRDIAEQLQQEFQELSSIYEEKNKSLDVAKDKLDTSKLDPMNIFGSVGMLPNQSISDYFYTKLELPIKAGETSIDMIHSWVDTQLTLPKLN